MGGDLVPVIQHVIGDVTPVALGVGDRVLLASDGLTDVVPEPKIALTCAVVTLPSLR